MDLNSGDQGFNHNGTTISTRRKPGEVLSTDEIEGMLAPLVPHVIDYFNLMDRKDLVPLNQQPGNFSDRNREYSVSSDLKHQQTLRSLSEVSDRLLSS